MSPEGNDEKEKKKIRTNFSVDQISELENNFVQKKYLTSAERAELATELGVTLQQVGGHLSSFLYPNCSDYNFGQFETFSMF